MGWGLLLLKGRLLQGVFLALFCGAVQGIWISHGKSSNPYEKYANAYKGLVEGPQELERSLPRDDFTTKGVQGNTLEVGTIVRAQWRQGVLGDPMGNHPKRSKARFRVWQRRV